MKGFRARLAEDRPLLLDGGLGTMLLARGLPAGQPPERWVRERPEVLAEVHRAYVAAGSEAVHACTFGANRLRLRPYGLEPEIGRLNREAVVLARASGARFVLADLGPTGEYRPPVGQGDPAAWAGVFREQAALLAEAGADGLHVETMSDLLEARTCLAAAREGAPDLPVMVSLTVSRKRRGFFTVMGDPLAEALRVLAEEGAAAVGVNCTLMSGDMAEVARAARAAVAVPLVLQPNAGTPEVTPAGIRYAQDPEAFAADLAPLVDLGVRILGGCCGTDPRFIAALRRRLGP